VLCCQHAYSTNFAEFSHTARQIALYLTSVKTLISVFYYLKICIMKSIISYVAYYKGRHTRHIYHKTANCSEMRQTGASVKGNRLGTDGKG